VFRLSQRNNPGFEKEGDGNWGEGLPKECREGGDDKKNRSVWGKDHGSKKTKGGADLGRGGGEKT